MTDDNPYESPRETSSEDRGQSLGATDYVAAALRLVIWFFAVSIVLLLIASAWNAPDSFFPPRGKPRLPDFRLPHYCLLAIAILATLAGWLGAFRSLAKAKGRAARLAALHEEQQLAIQSAKQRKAATKSEIRNPKQI